jgi:multidrug resistance efflux pump
MDALIPQLGDTFQSVQSGTNEQRGCVMGMDISEQWDNDPMILRARIADLQAKLAAAWLKVGRLEEQERAADACEQRCNNERDWRQELQAKLATAEADVARYEFLRQHKARASSLCMDSTAEWHFTGGWPPLIGPNLDWAIDAAIATWNSERAKEVCGE